MSGYTKYAFWDLGGVLIGWAAGGRGGLPGEVKIGLAAGGRGRLPVGTRGLGWIKEGGLEMGGDSTDGLGWFSVGCEVV